jgi:hypothetical protein
VFLKNRAPHGPLAAFAFASPATGVSQAVGASCAAAATAAPAVSAARRSGQATSQSRDLASQSRCLMVVSKKTLRSFGPFTAGFDWHSLTTPTPSFGYSLGTLACRCQGGLGRYFGQQHRPWRSTDLGRTDRQRLGRYVGAEHALTATLCSSCHTQHNPFAVQKRISETHESRPQTDCFLFLFTLLSRPKYFFSALALALQASSKSE